MKAIVTAKFASSPAMAIAERSKPIPRTGHSLIRMRAATINQLSNTLRRGELGSLDAPMVLGNEGSGVIEQSARFAAGTRVAIYGGNRLGITEDGLYQQWVSVDDTRIVPLPDALSFEQGAALSVNYLTAYLAATRTVRTKPGQRALVSGATGSVGHALVQVLNALDAKPIAVVSSTAKGDQSLRAGAYASVDLSTQDLDREVSRLTDGNGADLAFDPAGGTRTSALMRNLRAGGELVSIGFTGGKLAEIDLVDVVVGEKAIRGYSLHSESDENITQALQEVLGLAAKGVLKPLIDSSFPMEAFEEAYERLASRDAMGSIVIQLQGAGRHER